MPPVGYGPVMAHPPRDTTEGLLAWLRDRGDCELEPGLTLDELTRAQRVLRLTMPPRWRAVLLRAHPVARTGSGARYPNWRSPDQPPTRDLVEAPERGVLFDVAENGFWWHGWGAAPADPDERLSLAEARLAEVPRLTPLVGHWYVGDSDDSPVFSIVQADLFVPALSLADLLDGRGQADVTESGYPIGTVPFWSELHAYSQLGHHAEQRFKQLGTGGL
jgi:hypothetical protein